MYWWIFGIILTIYAIRFIWKTYTHPSNMLGRQAANMNWAATGRVKDEDGYKNIRLTRNDMEAVISFKNGNVLLTKPDHKTSFKDFIEIERWIASNETTKNENDETCYYHAIEEYIKEIGYYELVLELQGTDKEFCMASMKVYKAGYLSNQPEKVVGALVIEAASKYAHDKKSSLLFLKNLENNYFDENQV